MPSQPTLAEAAANHTEPARNLHQSSTIAAQPYLGDKGRNRTTTSPMDTPAFAPALNSSTSRLWVTLIFAVAMAWVESAVVFDLRHMIGRIDPYQADPLPLIDGLAKAELLRELATMIMLATVGWLAGWNLRSRIGHFLAAFGTWDIFYYVFLKVLTAWPNSLLDWDILFLIPLPWWGPVLAPCLIAGLMIVTGVLLALTTTPLWDTRNARLAWGACGLGILLGLTVFMWDAIQTFPEGTDALRQLLPTRFHWVPFSLAWVMMAAPSVYLLRARPGVR